jgi:hypothetical protein
MLQKVEQFTNEAIGKQFKFTLMKSATVVANDQQMLEEERTFFSSELVAKAYKCLGIIQNDEASKGFWPCHFTHKADGKLKFTENTYIGDE